MSEVIKLRKGLNIKLKGSAEKALEKLPTPATVALKPTNFPGLTPKLSVKVDAEVKAGEALFYDKYHPEIVFTAPIGGKVVSINRGERRRILEVVIATDKNAGSAEFKKAAPSALSAEEVKEQILKSGLWPFIKKRPYGIIANPEEKPKAIYISTFDTAPMAPDYDFVLQDQMDTFQTGVDVLAKLTEGDVNLGVKPGSAFSSVKNVVINTFEGPHPAGNVGIQIANTNPINKGDVVWTINVQDVLFIGRLFETGKVDFTKTIAFTGSEVKAPKYFETIVGAPIKDLVSGKLTTAGYSSRIISGNVLTGDKVSEKSFLSYYDSQVSVIPEGDDYEFMGWADPGFGKFSATKAYFGKLFPKKEYTLNANLHGGERAFVVSNQYEKYVPMDILPVFLLKAIMVNDIDKMEQLGIYEVIEEDFALCEYACTSKIEVQKILREGINTMIKELG
ncbi:Na(+)-translocating NADH-quinone reductase subunit A [uncultured Draconibacterium sp.]|uniref:Na(+)-translocating NADH-quinone reductase subunit A n=1 Tax=uncultured Draconibacterium sp. TaxID=1573823 RepID=UPI0025F32283|nr:Na(+)-translocating NADH-quinone reductase subunit A [uncultured Draconibacterium sp.]